MMKTSRRATKTSPPTQAAWIADLRVPEACSGSAGDPSGSASAALLVGSCRAPRPKLTEEYRSPVVVRHLDQRNTGNKHAVRIGDAPGAASLGAIPGFAAPAGTFGGVSLLLDVQMRG
jgi:hypothetical protein